MYYINVFINGILLIINAAIEDNVNTITNKIIIPNPIRKLDGDIPNTL